MALPRLHISEEVFVPQGFFKFSLYGISVLVPLAGFIIGLAFYREREAAVRQFGKICLLCAFLATTFLFFLGFGLGFLAALLGPEGR